jgi:hypothetical protein
MWRCSLAVNQNGFNSRITSEALEERFRQVFPAQAGAELIQDLYASGVIVPTIDFTSIAEGSFLPESLQQAWDFSTGFQITAGASNNLVTTPGFWRIQGTCVSGAPAASDAKIQITDGISTQTVFAVENSVANNERPVTPFDFIVFLRVGDTLSQTTTDAQVILASSFRQVASVNGTLVNPLGFTF